MKINVILGKTIIDLRNSKSYTQIYCAKRIGSTQQKWSDYELGKSALSMDIIFKICRLFKIHPVVFMCTFFENAVKAKALRLTDFNEYMSIIHLAPKLVKKDKVTYAKQKFHSR